MTPDSDISSVWYIGAIEFDAPPPEGSLAEKQKEWNSPAVAKDAKMVVEAARDPIDRARLLAVAAPHASDWLNALPIASCGLRLDDEINSCGYWFATGFEDLRTPRVLLRRSC